MDRMLAGQSAETATAETKEFIFDGVFGSESSQRDVFMQVGLPVLRESMKGVNGTILAYGQTGSGKTHSLLHQTAKGEEAGLLPRLVASLYVQVTQDIGYVYEIEAASVQVYNEQIDDLLHADHQSGGGQNLKVQDNGVVPGLTWIKCKNPNEMLEAFTRARANVVYAETKMNKASSRSHAVFQIKLTKRQRVLEASSAMKMEVTTARLNVVDLAGSERVKKSGAEGMRFQEATAINKSLLAFGNVVSALAAKKAHVPLRDSKLTRILDGSIGGNCRTALLVCASPATENAGETVNTFDFASRAMRVEVDAKVNSSIVEISAKALLADLAGDSEHSVPLAPQLEALKKESAAAAAKAKAAEAAAKAEAEKNSKAILEAQLEAKKLQQAASEAEERSRKWQEQAESHQKNHADAFSEAEQMRSAVQKSAKEAKEAKVTAEAALKESEKLRKAVEKAEKEALEWKATAELRAKEVKEVRVVQAKKDTTELVKKKEEVVQVQKEMAKATKDVMEVKKQVTQVTQRAEKAEELVAKAEEAVKVERERAVAAEAATESAVAAVREEAKKEVLEVEKRIEEVRHLSKETLAAAAEEAESLKQTLQETEEKAAKRTAELETALASQTEELERKSALLDEAQAAIEALKKEADAKEERLREEHEEELRALREEQELEVERIKSEVSTVRGEGVKALEELQKSLDEERVRHKGEATTLEVMFSHKAALWQEEKEQLAQDYAAAADAQRKEFEAKLKEGAEYFEAKLAEVESKAERERAELTKQLDDAKAEILEKERSWKEIKEMAVREAWENGNSQQRKLAAAFKAARNIASMKEAELKTAHADLAKRFASRESREDDIAKMAQQEKSLKEQQRRMLEKDRAMVGLALELQNREDMDRIFGSAEKRRRPVGMGTPIVGKKLGETHQFSDREKRRLGASQRPRSGHSSSSANPLHYYRSSSQELLA
eukprot:TRINITY_DN37042_c0_g1_i1.p1 TRINITY_DN37042_c0_g1~~TRINITY_DN37042_c0_g1_i1.p1  ORF type:complete len:1025 (-),score=314.59 TRINITY_DN37042_c0_g1_i1:86-2953(-)